jgi:Flp pilus assembly protein TadB
MVAHDKERIARQRSLCRAYRLAARQRERHGNIQTLCRAAFLCRVVCRIFAVMLLSVVQIFFVVCHCGVCRAIVRCRALL